MNHHHDTARGLTRRDFLRGMATATAAATVGGLDAALAAEAEKGGLKKRVLGRTKLKVTEVSFGGLQISNRNLLDAAIDKGINLVHTCAGYSEGRSIKAFGEVMKTKRDKVYLALKGSPSGIDAELKILNTDHVDLFVPPLHSVEEMRHPQLPELLQKLKDQGKIRFTGFSCHDHVPAVMKEAIQLGLFDVMLVAYNVQNQEQVDPILREAKEKQKMGFLVMKGTRGLDRSKPELMAAGLKKLLSNKDVDTLLIGMSNFEELTRNVAICGQALTWREERELERHVRAMRGRFCASCGACSICPRGVRVGDIMRCLEYAERGERQLAVATYRALPPAGQGINCEACGRCEAVCSSGLPLVRRLREAHAQLA